MKQGKDYIIFPLDVASDQAARQMVRHLHTHIGMFKVGLELFIRTGPELLQWIGDHTGRRMPIVQLASLMTVICFFGVFLDRGFWGLALVMINQIVKEIASEGKYLQKWPQRGFR
ncbi:MAG: hypothetical protein P8017_04230, partial [Deltaproteobacteria bacterium]